MKTSLIVILFLLCSQILSQIESKDKINYRDFLRERKIDITNPPNQREPSFETNSFQNNESKRIVNKTVLNDAFLLIEEIGQLWYSANWVNFKACFGIGCETPGGRHTYLYNESNNLIEDLWQDWDGTNGINFWKSTYTYDANNNNIEYLSQNWDDSSWVNNRKNIYSYDANNNMVEDLLQNRIDSTWVNGVKSTYTYDANNNMIEDLYQFWDGSSWGDPPYKNIYIYDANNNMIEDLYKQRDGSSLVNYSRIIYTYQSITKIEQLAEVIESFNLSNNYPNPFNPSTTIKYQLPSNHAYRQAGGKR